MTQMSHIGKGVVLRVGELFLKGRNRYIFEDKLEENARRILAQRDDVQVVRKRGRLFVLGAGDEALVTELKALFGIVSLSPAVFCERSLDAINQVALDMVKDLPPGIKTFRIRARRPDKTFEYTSTDIGRIVGAEVVKATGLGVDLETADLSIGVEVGNEWTFLWSSSLKGAGGLPVGTGGKALLLLSGGIDSPVAGHLIQKRGVELNAVYFHSYPHTSDGAKDKVVRLAKVLANRQKEMTVFVVSFTKLQELFRDKAPPSYLVLLYRRAMIRIGEMIARDLKTPALITGESLGQVASQTLPNLTAIQAVAGVPVLRPLIGFDKAETIALAQQIGTYDISIIPHDDCCSLFVPKHPETKASHSRVRAIEDQIDWQPLLEDAALRPEIINCG